MQKRLLGGLIVAALTAALPANGAPPDEDYLTYSIPKDAVGKSGEVRPGYDYVREIDYRVGEKLVAQQRFWKNGQMYSETLFKDGMKHGVERFWYDNHQIRFESPYKAGAMHGVFKQWDRDGKLLGSFEMKEGTGVRKLWHDNGQLDKEEPYKDGKEDGTLKFYFPDGKPRQIIHYKEGQAHGVSRIWDKGGKLTENSPLYYVNGKKVSKEEYDKAAEKDSSLPKDTEDDK
jgi:antitoxin component YwqK of YwqJK toxin-antitoxin module